MHLENIVKELGEKVGIPNLKFSDEGVITFEYDDKYTINLEKSTDENQLTIYGVVKELPPDKKEALLITLLDANLFGLKTQGACFGIDTDTEEIILFKTFRLEQLSFDRFFNEFNQFLQTLQHWTDRLHNSDNLLPGTINRPH